jgi:AcrR family transcriptional regulator
MTTANNGVIRSVKMTGLRERTGRGRQAEAARNDRAVLEAARTVLAAQGPDAPVSAIAAAAGVGMGSLYRRFPSKESLLQHLCEASLAEQVSAAERALAAPPDEALPGYVRDCVAFRAGAFTPLAGTLPASAAMADRARRLTALLRDVVTRARAARAARHDLTPQDVLDVVELFSRHPDGDGRDRLLAIALAGLRPDGAQLPVAPRHDSRRLAAGVDG